MAKQGGMKKRLLVVKAKMRKDPAQVLGGNPGADLPVLPPPPPSCQFCLGNMCPERFTGEGSRATGRSSGQRREGFHQTAALAGLCLESRGKEASA